MLTIEGLKPKPAYCKCGACRLGHWSGNRMWHHRAGFHVTEGECPECGDNLPDPRLIEKEDA